MNKLVIKGNTCCPCNLRSKDRNKDKVTSKHDQVTRTYRKHDQVTKHSSHVKCACGVQQVRSTSWPAEVALAVVLTLWSSFVLSLSFLDTLIRSNAPFLRRAIDRDIGRSVHALSLIASFMQV